MKTTFRSGCIAFVFAVLFAASATATTPEEAVKQWSLSINNAIANSQNLELPLRSSLRSSAELKLRMDSFVILGIDSETGIVTYPQKYAWDYNLNGQHFLTLHFYDKDVNGDWIMDEKSVKTYDAQNHIKFDSIYRLDTKANRMFLSEIHEYLFNPNGVTQMESRKHRNGGEGAWIGDYKKEYHYDALGKLILQNSYRLTGSDSWGLSNKIEYSYDTFGKLAIENQYSWDGIKWIPLSRKDHAYDEQQRDTAVLLYNFQKLESQWSLSSRDLNRYDTGGHLLLHLNDLWDDDAQKWLSNEKDEYEYDTFGNKILETSFDMDTSTMEWTPSSKEEWSFDEKGNILSQTNYSLYIENQQWLFGVITTYEYDLNIRSKDVIGQFSPVEKPANNLITGGKLSIFIGGSDSIVDLANMYLYYSNMEVSGVKSIMSNSIPWYYNSITKIVTFGPSITPSTLYLFDLQGRKVLTRQVSNSTTLSLNELSKGLYLMRLDIEGVVQRGKLMVK